MRSRLTASGILSAWEVGAARRPLDRALAILWAAGAGHGNNAADLALTERDRRLLEIRGETFGPKIPVRATCPDCGSELEMDIDAPGLAENLPSLTGTADDPRQITSRDLAAVSSLPSEEIAATLRQRLCGRLVQGAEADALDTRIQAMAKEAALTTQITCAECETVWSETLDVAMHVWADVENAALGLLGDVAEIATAFGWAEQEILSLSPSRRMTYLTHVRQA